ncbi:DUF1648 domain-containing protein [Streptosporangium carneum]|uniref:DUF1648 domain-containing protein n=1 Tax=Streptosporangium carneum TaxID=47481 RepID=A0A9W6MDH6_9ACTN|nr:DUF1648 domain-containing protein [Streptosporangium carneum]GLK10181.1 hypothetical protein GCM10017600_35870 [Streptosporangium carneum]
MILRGRAALALAWGAFVTVVMVGVPLVLRDRLPDPLATHWNGAGVPNGHMTFTVNLVSALLLWGVGWGVLLVLALRGPALSTRLGRAGWCGFLFGWSVLAVGVQASTLHANLDVADWRQAALPAWQVVTVVVAAVAAGVLAGVLGRGGPDPRHDPAALPTMRLRPGQRAVWVSRATNHWLAGLSLAALAGALATGVLAATGVMSGEVVWINVAVLATVALVGAGTCSVRVRVDAEGLRVGFGALGRPARHTPVAGIESAWVETRSPAEVGGWGVRGLPGAGRVTFMLRGGECLVVRRVTGGEFAVSVDDARNGAALLNAYVAETVGS